MKREILRDVARVLLGLALAIALTATFSGCTVDLGCRDRDWHRDRDHHHRRGEAPKGEAR